MADQLIYHDIPDSAKETVRNYWARKLPRFDRLLSNYGPDAQTIRLTLRHQAERYEADGIIILPTGTLVGRAAGSTYQEAIDLAVDTLVAELRKHRRVIRRDYEYRRQNRSGDVDISTPLLETHRRENQRGRFNEVLRPVLRALRDHARQELAVALAGGQLKPGVLTTHALAEQVAQRAWDSFDDRPAAWPPDRWIVDLMHDVIDEHAAQSAAPSSTGGAPVPAAPKGQNGTVPHEFTWPDGEQIQLSELLPTGVEPPPWQHMPADQQQRWIVEQLQTIPRSQRRALSLYVLDGWDETDIAELQRRSREEVRADILTARETLRDRLLQVA
jgi:ribosome-associated translation inhibitor RaiA/DNA-directed RNA polymerase specialized sigma24 family protein